MGAAMRLLRQVRGLWRQGAAPESQPTLARLLPGVRARSKQEGQEMIALNHVLWFVFVPAVIGTVAALVNEAYRR